MGNVTHLYFTNSLYRYASLQANRLDKTNCYVCTLMPTSYFHPRLKSRLLSFQATICVGEKCAPDNWGYSKPFYDTNDIQVQDPSNNTHPRLKSRLLSFQATICVGEKCAPDNWGYSKPFYDTNDIQVQDPSNNTHP